MLTSQLTGGKKKKRKKEKLFFFYFFFSCEGLKELRMLILEKKIIGRLGVWGQGNLSCL